MKSCFFLLFLFVGLAASASNYYIDPSADSLKARGTKDNPWTNLAMVNSSMRLFRSGDTVFFKKGELYFGKLNIRCSGSANVPVVFTSFGTAPAKPVFLLKIYDETWGTEPNMVSILKSNYILIEGFEVTDDGMDKQNRTLEALTRIAFSIEESANITIRNCEISLVGVGVNVVGHDNMISRCKFYNLRMIRNTVGGDDDYGANPVVLAGSNNTVTRCEFRDCWAESYDFAYDGGAVEMFDANASNNKIIANTAVNCNGFMEFGSSNGGVSENNFVVDNLIINCGDVVYVNNKGTYAITVKNLHFFNNKIIETFPQLTKPGSLFSMTTTSSIPNVLDLKNNIFWLTYKKDILKAENFSATQLSHKNNIYYLTDGSLNFNVDKTEKTFNKNSVVFNPGDSSKGLPMLNPDLFPFKYLFIFWEFLFWQ